MQKHHRLILGLIIAAVTIVGFSSPDTNRDDTLPETSLPNILFILADDLGYGDVGVYNSESKVPTPHLDQFASAGMRFTDAHSPATVCTPTRYSVMTGRMAFRTGYRGVFTGVGGPCLIEKDGSSKWAPAHRCRHLPM